MSAVNELINHITLPKFVKVHQLFDRNDLSQEEIRSRIETALKSPDLAGRIKPGQRICITGGSRGISNMPFVTKLLADYVKSQGASPFIVPAMGSHGGATAEG